MNVQFLGQPWQDGTNLDDFLADVTSQTGPSRLRMAVAWAKRSGLVRIQPHLDAWRKGGGLVEMVIGLSEGGATRQGLELALQMADSVHLFHDVSGRTFHPKVYLAETAESANLLVGSNNMTAGGLFFNYEAALVVRVAAAEATSAVVVQQVDAWFDRLLSDPDCCRELTDENLAALVADSAYRIGDEDHRRKAAKGETGAPEEVDAVTPTEDEQSAPFFDRSQSAKKKARHDPATPSSTSGAGYGGASSPQGSGTQAGSGGAATPPPQGQPTPAVGGHGHFTVERWSKRLKGTDAQQPPGKNTSPTHNLRLAAAGHPIDITTYFRDEFFDTTTWQPDPDNAIIEFTHVDLEVFIYGVPQGTYEFRIDHNLNRVSGQGNVPTVFKWGPMGDYMRKNNHVDDWALLEKYDNNTFALKIEATDPGTS